MWLYGVARRVMANQQRGERRRERLAAELGRELVAAAAMTGEPGPAGRSVADALSRLTPQDQEVLRLVAWEDLGPREIASVLGMTQVAARSRLHRARKRLRTQLEQPAAVDEFDQWKVQEAR